MGSGDGEHEAVRRHRRERLVEMDDVEAARADEPFLRATAAAARAPPGPPTRSSAARWAGR